MATWLRTGTASVTNGNATVTFTGADVIAASIRTGDAFHAPDSRVYEIDTIDSATQVTLAQTYLGSTASGQSYAIQPTRGVVTDLYNSVQTLISSVSGYVSGVLAGLFPAGTAATPSIAKSGDTDTGLFWPAANQLAAATGGVQRWLLSSTAFQVDVPITGTSAQSSVTDSTAGRLLKVGAFGLGEDAGPVVTDLDAHGLSGFYYSYGGQHASAPAGTNPFPDLGGAFGLVTGTGTIGAATEYLWQVAILYSASAPIMKFRSKATAWTDWEEVYSTSNLIGTVSESGGTPTGSILEKGSNANGNYVRFADGTQICDVRLNSSSAGAVTWTFPAAFADVPQVSATPNQDQARFATTTAGAVGSVNFSVWNTAQARLDAISTSLIAIGRWY